MAEQFKLHGVQYTLLSIPNGEHGLSGADPRQIDDAYAAMREFVIRHMEMQ